MPEEVVLFDLRSRAGTCFALNPWKTRALLNYKCIPYRTHWLEYPDVAPTLSAAGVPAHPPGSYTAYTTPAILYDGAYTMGSLEIAKVLEAACPSPSAHLDDPRLPRVIKLLDEIVQAILCEFIAKVPRNVLGPQSAEYWHATRSKWVGMPVDEYERTQSKDSAWERANPLIAEIAAMLTEHDDGPFMHGKEPGYADILMATMLRSYRSMDEGVYQQFVKVDKAMDDLLEASRLWLARDDY